MPRNQRIHELRIYRHRARRADKQRRDDGVFHPFRNAHKDAIREATRERIRLERREMDIFVGSLDGVKRGHLQHFNETITLNIFHFIPSVAALYYEARHA